MRYAEFAICALNSWLSHGWVITPEHNKIALHRLVVGHPGELFRYELNFCTVESSCSVRIPGG